MNITARLILIMLLTHNVAAVTVNACLDARCYTASRFSFVDVYSIQSCINIVAPCYFNCLKASIDNFDNVQRQHFQGNGSFFTESIENLKLYGRFGAYFSIAASSLFILISVYLKRYGRWIEQIILSKVVCDLISAAVLLGQFDDPLLSTSNKRISNQEEAKNTVVLASFGLEVATLFGLIWIPILFFEVRNVVMFPFSGWDTSKLVTRWCIVVIVSFAWSCILFIEDIKNVANFFQYSPIIFVGREESKEGTNRCVLVFFIEIECVDKFYRALWLLVYAPVAIVFVLIIVAMLYIAPQLKGSNGAAGSADISRVKAKVLRVSGWYLGSFLVYFIMLLVCYAIGANVHTCSDGQPAPFCLSWTGWDCAFLRHNQNAFNSQRAFIFLFCARGVLDFIIFFVFSFRKLVLRLKDREYEGDDQDRQQRLELHDAYRKEIMNMIQIGISRSAIETHKLLDRGQARDASIEPSDADFTAIEDVDVLNKAQTIIQMESSQPSRWFPSASPNSKRLIRFQALAPKVFESIRRSASISASDYAEAMNPSRTGVSDETFNIEESQANVLIEKLSEGKGGAFFYFSQNYKFVIKTISDGEYNFMCNILREMWERMKQADTILSRYFGVYTFLYRGADIKIVVMENVSYMYPRLPIHRKYDLKGSWVARRMMSSNEPQTVATVVDKRTLKDMDMYYSVAVSPKLRKDLIEAIQKDIDFLAGSGIMDYSLFLCFHIKDASDSLGSEHLDLNETRQPAHGRERSDSANLPFKGLFRENQGGVFVQLNSTEPFAFLRRPDGSRVQKFETRSRSSTGTKDSYPLMERSGDGVFGGTQSDANIDGNARSKKNPQAQVISVQLFSFFSMSSC